MRSRIGVIVLAVGVAAGTLSGCSGGSGGSATRAPTTSTRAATSTTTATSGTVPAEAGLPPKGTAAYRATRGFLAGYPLVVTERTIQMFAGLAGVNHLLRVPRLANEQSRLVVAPNHDTTYVIGVLDLRGEPQALTVPKIDRYYTFQLIDAWMHTVTNIGTRATKGEAGTWVVVPPGFTGTLPTGAHRIDSPTNQLVFLGRVRAVDDADAAKAFSATADLKLEPLSSLMGTKAAPPPPAMPKPAGTPQAVGADGLAYYDELGDDLTVNPPVDAAERTAIARMARFGVGAGLHPSTTATPAPRRVLTAAEAVGLKVLEAPPQLNRTLVDGWSVDLSLGDPSANRSLVAQALIARHYWGPNVAAESVYPVLITADDGHPLTGARDYVIHLDRAHLPPVHAFWSYTVYANDGFFFPNPGHRYALSGDTPGLVRNPDGSIDIYLSRSAPAGHQANWIPTPAGPFRLIMRLYLPGRAILDGTYRYPPVHVEH